jgi:hypothetical protein
VVVTRETLPPGATALRDAGVELPDSDALTRQRAGRLGVPAARDRHAPTARALDGERGAHDRALGVRARIDSLSS